MGFVGVCLDIYYKRILLYGMLSFVIILSLWFGFCEIVSGLMLVFLITFEMLKGVKGTSKHKFIG